jgi:ATP-binding cassette subfamily B protein
MLQTPVDRAFTIPSENVVQLAIGKPAITIGNLTVDYYTTDGKLKRSLDGVSLRILHGETIGVAGRSGSGKSTWIKAILRLVYPTTGNIWLGETSLEEVGRRELSRLVGYVGQSPFVVSASIRDNIAYGNQANDGDIRRAAELAHLHGEIDAMPHGYETVVAERGQNVSGGQRQRLALARILLKNAPILILDEATSALDNISERFVQRALGIRSGQRTTILIAHRLSTLKDCDRIFVFDDGRIVEQGTYEELSQGGGLFAELAASAAGGMAVVDGHSSSKHRGKFG